MKDSLFTYCEKAKIKAGFHRGREVWLFTASFGFSPKLPGEDGDTDTPGWLYGGTFVDGGYPIPELVKEENLEKTTLPPEVP